jgi:hypothetical protein
VLRLTPTTDWHAAGMTTDSPADQHRTAAPRTGRGPLAAAIVALLAMAPTGFFYAASGLLVPGPWLYLMWLLYLVLLGLGVWLARRGSYAVLAVPVVAAVAWWGIISLGEAYLDWTG